MIDKTRPSDQLLQAAQSFHGELAASWEAMGAGGPTLAALAADSFGTGATRHTDMSDLIATIQKELTAEVCLLVKGSRSNRLERLVQALSGTAAAGTH